MKRYIDADKLKVAIERRRLSNRYIDTEGYEAELFEIINSLQQEQPIKVYRVENEKEQKGLWRKFDGTWEPLFGMLTDGQCKDMPMDDSPVYREGGKRWFASAPSKETLQKWFSRRDLEELTATGFTITEFEVLEYRKLSDFEFIFTRESIVNKTNINVADIYPLEQPEVDIEKEIDFFLYGTYTPERFQNTMQVRDEHTGYKVNDWKFWVNKPEYQVEFARHFYELGLNARKEE